MPFPNLMAASSSTGDSTLLLFALVLLLSVLVSQFANRSVLSTAVVFLVAGFICGPGVTGALRLSPDQPIVSGFIELALFSVLYTDGMRVGIRDLTSAWKLPGRALLFGLPLTLVAVGVVAKFLLGLSWTEAAVIGAVLSPTDPVFAAAIVGREEVPYRLRHLLNVESGLNDGLALPLVLIALGIAGKAELELATMLTELGVGVAIGVVVPWIAIRLESTRVFASSEPYRPLLGFAIGLTVLALTRMFHANEFLAAFAAGMTIATKDEKLRERFHELGELLAELFKLAALLIFGALIDPSYFGEIGLTGWTFVFLTLVLARPLAMLVSFAGTDLTKREWVAAAWFGPKGFASVFFAFLVLQHHLDHGVWIFHLLAVTVGTSIIAHSSTDVIVARWFDEEEAQ
ncbi:cation:proton antiporter [Haloferula sargassicola]|uniref:K(+)/H(+) antiporter NhaP2 n=1 Tax=Haloferula sargassicola TaxID=490096 RepID=A0ABP9UGP9_9BACT